jgi:glycosyltransferase involved in cell wall biosynthesis
MKKIMKICMIGPSYPFRGGISHYTTLLYRNLKKKHDITFYAFKRQYPTWLFPGKTDRDYSNMHLKEKYAETWWQVFLKIKKDNPAMLIIPWWVSFWTPQFFIITTLLKICTQIKILFICHNVVEHESKLIDKICTRIVLKKGDYFIVHSGEDLENLKKIMADAKIKRSFHPTYEVFCTGSITKNEARRKLKLENNTILFFGFVRPYKGLDYLIEAMPSILKHLDVTLLIVGEFWRGEEEYRLQIEKLGMGDNVRIINEYIPNEDVELYFAASDLAVLPYVSVTGSGIVQTAFGCNKPIVSTSTGSLPEVIDDMRTGYIVPAGNSEALANAVVSFYKEGKEEEFVNNIKKDREKFSWDRIVEIIESFDERSN